MLWHNHEVLAAPRLNYRRKVTTKPATNHYVQPYLVLSLPYLVLNLQCTDMHNRRLLVNLRMKKFRINSIIFISVIAVIFGCNVFYLVQLYESIRKNVEREVMAAMTDADIDDLMVRAGRAQALASNFTMQEDADSVNSKAPRKAEASTYRDKNGQLISVRTEADGTVVEEKALLAEETPYSNQMIDAMSKQFHTIMDKYIGFDMVVMDSVLNEHLSRRYIYPEFVAVEVVNGNDSVLFSNTKVQSH